MSGHALLFTDTAALIRQALRAIAEQYAAELALPSVEPDDVLLMISLVGGQPSRQAVCDVIGFVVVDPGVSLDRAMELGLAEEASDGSIRLTTLAAQVFGRLLPITQRKNAQWRKSIAPDEQQLTPLELVLGVLRQEPTET